MGANRSERLADKLVNIFSDFRTDIRQAGRLFARVAPNQVYEKFDEFVQCAEKERTEIEIEEGAKINVYKFFNKV